MSYVINKTIRQERVQRVLDAARQWRKWRTCENSARSSWPEVNEVMDAIDELDAPVERYRIEEGSVTDGKYLIGVSVNGSRFEQDDMLKRIAAALNAAERKVPHANS